MNRDQYLEILLSVRSREEGKGDPQIEAAFQAMELDPELKKIWENQRQWDLAIKNSLDSIAVPADLRSRILCEKPSVKKVRSRMIPFPNSYWMPWAVAALLAVLLGIWRMESQAQERDFTVFEGHAVNYTQGLFVLSKKTPEWSEAQEWLKRKGTPHTFPLPFRVEGLSQLGCRQVEFCGIRSSMICYHISGSAKEVHLFIMSKEDVKNLPSLDIPDFHERKGSAIASWSDESHGYVLMGEISLAEMKKLF